MSQPANALNILVGLPHYRSITSTQTAVALMTAAHALGHNKIPFQAPPLDWGDIAAARNILASYMLNKTDCTHLLFVDWDQQCRAEAIIRMIAADKDFIGLISPARPSAIPDGKPIRFNVSHGPAAAPGGILPVDKIATGIVLISRRCLEQLAPAVRVEINRDVSLEFSGDSGPLYGFFDPIHSGNKILSEDVSFCERWRGIGGEIFAIVDEVVGHLSTIIVRGKYSDSATEAASRMS